MDQELLTYLKEQFHEIRQQIGGLSGETRERFETMEAQIGGLRGETRERFDKVEVRFETVEAQIEGLREESREGVHHTRILLEDLRGYVRLLAEGMTSVTERMGRLEKDLNRKLEELWNMVVTPVRGLVERVAHLEEVEDRRCRDILEVIRERFGVQRET